MSYKESVWNAYQILVDVLYKDSGYSASKNEMEHAIEKAIRYLTQALD